MITSSAAYEASARPWQAGGVGGWLAFAASPTFGVIAWLVATGRPPNGLCSVDSSLLPIDGMTAMYLLMSLFHMPPWLKLAFRPSLTKGD